MLFGLAIEKSNIEADLMQIELPGSEFCRDTNQTQRGATICQMQIGNRGDMFSI